MYIAITTNLVFCIATIHNVYFILFIELYDAGRPASKV